MHTTSGDGSMRSYNKSHKIISFNYMDVGCWMIIVNAVKWYMCNEEWKATHICMSVYGDYVWCDCASQCAVLSLHSSPFHDSNNHEDNNNNRARARARCHRLHAHARTNSVPLAHYTIHECAAAEFSETYISKVCCRIYIFWHATAQKRHKTITNNAEF